MELEELIVEIVIGLFLLFTSYQIGIKENITLLHGYLYTQLDPNVYIVVDMELKGLIREALIKMILGFDIALEIEEE